MNVSEYDAATNAAKDAIFKMAGSREIDLIAITEATWPDASLGWPEPGKSYAQMLTDGYRILATLGSRSFECRVSGDTVRCRESGCPVK